MRFFSRSLIQKSPHTLAHAYHSCPRRLFSSKPANYNPGLKLPVLNQLVGYAKNKPCGDFSNTAIIGVQHLLESTTPLFKSLIELGVNPENCYFRGKSYSTYPKVAEQLQSLGINIYSDIAARRPGHYQSAKLKAMEDLWEKFLIGTSNKNEIKKLIILDEGGGCFETLPPEIWHSQYAIAAIEQTSQGLQNPFIDTFSRPLIEVASSAAKQKIESELIAAGVVKKLESSLKGFDFKKNHHCGVIGNGAIGHAVTKYLLSLGCTITVFDEDKDAFKEILGNKCFRVSNVGAVITSSNLIFGCTGKDTLRNTNILELINSDKYFISCSSGDIEFQSLLKKIAPSLPKRASPLENIIFENKKGKKIELLRGGYPINFDNSASSGTPSDDIAFTRGLLLAGLLQGNLIATRPTANGLFLNKTLRLALDYNLQRFIVSCFPQFAHYPGLSQQHLDNFKDPTWIERHSGGITPENLGSNFDDLSTFKFNTSSPKLTR